MGEKLVKMNTSRNVCEMIDYLNSIIDTLDIKVTTTGSSGVQIAVPNCILYKVNDKNLLQCKQYKTIDKIMVTIRPQYRGNVDDEKFTFKSLKELKLFGIENQIREKYNKLCGSQDIKWEESNIRDSNVEVKLGQENVVNEPQDNNSIDVNDIENLSGTITETEKDALVKIRIGQSRLRKKLISQECECKICKLSDEKFLILSHIKPWSKSNNYEKLDENNVFLLCPNHDSLFDKGYITFDESGKIIISKNISAHNKILLNINENIKIEIKEENKKYLKWHRKNKLINEEN